MTDRELMQQALEKLEFFSHMKSVSEDTMRLIADLRDRLAQREQEPYCYHDGRNIVGKEYADHSDVFPLYTAPPKKKWVGLSDEEKYDVLEGATGDGGRVYYDTLFRSYEAKLKEKNT